MENRYYGLYDMQMIGFVGGYASTDLIELIQDSFGRIVELSEGNEEPFSMNDNPIDVLDTAGYEIHRIDKSGYDKIEECSDYLFLSQPIRGIESYGEVDLKNFDLNSLYNFRELGDMLYRTYRTGHEEGYPITKGFIEELPTEDFYLLRDSFIIARAKHETKPFNEHVETFWAMYDELL